jgi:hypothetical protein
MSTPATSQAWSTVKPLGIRTACPSTKTSSASSGLLGSSTRAPPTGSRVRGSSGSAGATAAPASGEPAAAVGEIQRHEAAVAGQRKERMGLERRSARATKAMAAARRLDRAEVGGGESPCLAGVWGDEADAAIPRGPGVRWEETLDSFFFRAERPWIIGWARCTDAKTGPESAV